MSARYFLHQGIYPISLERYALGFCLVNLIICRISVVQNRSIKPLARSAGSPQRIHRFLFGYEVLQDKSKNRVDRLWWRVIG